MSSFVYSNDNLMVIMEDGQSFTVSKNSPIFNDVVSAVNAKDWEKAYTLAHPSVAVQQNISAHNLGDVVRIEDGVVFYKNHPVDNSLTDRMVKMVREDIDVTHIVKFFENLMQNPSSRAVNELYGFLEASDLPITDDGCFLAYKRIRKDWTDCHTGSINNEVGAVVEMPRNMVNDDKEQTCSSGLHFCSREYLKFYGSSDGGRVVMIKINPADVVSIPVDYDNAKGRCCRYEVIEELQIEDPYIGDRYAMPENIEGLIRMLNSACTEYFDGAYMDEEYEDDYDWRSAYEDMNGYYSSDYSFTVDSIVNNSEQLMEQYDHYLEMNNSAQADQEYIDWINSLTK